jgi:predicted dehydrogenase
MTESISRIYLIGAGYIARQHAAAIALLPGGDSIELAVADPSPAAREGFAQEFPAARLVPDATELLAEPARAGDVVIVATPPFTHRDLALQAFQSGRHVLCEKPLAMNTGEASDMLAAARAAGRVLGCCSSRFLDLATTVAAREAIEAGTLGTPYHATWVHRTRRGRGGIEYQPTSSWFLDRSRSGGGTLMDWGPYDLSTLFQVLQPDRVTVSGAWMTSPETATSLAPEVVFDVEQHVGATLRLERHGQPALTVTYERAACTHGAERQINEIEGSDGAIRWDWLDWVGDSSMTTTTDMDGQPVEEVTRLAPATVGVHQRALVQFAAHLRGEASASLTNERAVFTFACLRAIHDAAASGQPRTVSLGEVRDGTAS